MAEKKSTPPQNSHSALYRTYRPHAFDAVRGQEKIVRALQGALQTKRIAHAYLFSGGRGTGKTSIARIMAKELGVGEDDVYEIDAASNRGIDEIRSIRESVHVPPFASPYKVYIIDEVHMLTKEAFNALLKTLEEPPAHAIFILATTEREKVPETIISRCQSFSFALPSLTILTELVQQVAAAEKYTIDEYTAGLVARSGDGSFRDTLGALEKVMTASTDKNLSREEVEAILGVPPHELIQKFITALAEKKLPEAMGALGALTGTATALPTVLELALTTTRDALLLKHTNTATSDEPYLKTLIALPHFGLPLHQMLLDAALALRRSPLPKQALEAAVIGWCVAGK